MQNIHSKNYNLLKNKIKETASGAQVKKSTVSDKNQLITELIEKEPGVTKVVTVNNEGMVLIKTPKKEIHEQKYKKK